jgi:hypothetical protein
VKRFGLSNDLEPRIVKELFEVKLRRQRSAP